MSGRASAPVGLVALAADPAAPAPRAGDTYWNTAVGALRAYDGAGWQTVGAPSRFARVSGANVTSIVVAAGNITGLAIPIAANEIVQVKAVLSVGCSSTGGVKLAVTIPSGTIEAGAIGVGATATATISARITGTGVLTAAFCAVASTGPVRLDGLVTNGATPGNIQLQFAAGVAAQTATVFIGSYIEGVHRS